MIKAQSLACASLALGLMPVAALAATDIATDLEIQLVDANNFPVEGVDIFVSDATGHTIIAEVDAANSVSAVATGDSVKIALPELNAFLEVPLTGHLGTAITLNIGDAKRPASVASVKPFAVFPELFSGVGPSNDDCANATAIADGDTAFSTVGATTDGASGFNNNDIWYLYTASCTGVATFSTCNQADFDTDLVILTGDDCGTQVVLNVNDDVGGCAGNSSILTAPVEAGTTYLLSVGGFGAADVGTGTLSVSCAAAAPNDFCSGALAIEVGSTTMFNNSANTNSPSDPIMSCIFNLVDGFGSTWFSIVPDTTAIFLDTSASTGSTDTVVAVYTGGCDGLVEIACNDDIDLDGGNFLSNLLADGLTPGDEYLIRVSTFAEASAGDITLEVTNAAGPLEVCNGTGANTATLSSTDGLVIGSDFSATSEPAGPGRLGISLAEDFLVIGAGEVLIFRPVTTIFSATGEYTVAIPDDANLVGITLYLQAIAADGTLTNALKGDITDE